MLQMIEAIERGPSKLQYLTVVDPTSVDDLSRMSFVITNVLT